MIEFYIASIILVIIASLFVIWPLIRQKKENKLEVTNVRVIKQRIEELDDELQQGLISQKDKEIAIKELKIALYEESQDIDAGTKRKQSVSAKLILILALPAIAIGLWVYISSNHLEGLAEYNEVLNDTDELIAKVQGENAQDVSPNDYAKYALLLRNRLRESPEDARGWSLLGQVQLAIGRIEEAKAAYEKALRISPSAHDIRYRYANALMAAGNESSLAEANRQVDYLIETDSSNRDYRLLKTVVATQLGRAEEAGISFAMIKGQLLESSNFYQSLVTQLRKIGVDERYLGQTKETKNGTSISLSVKLADELRSSVPENGFLIVFAQDANSDSRVPLAVKKLPLSDFPLTVNLSEMDAMLPQMNLNSVNAVKLTARVSKDEDVMPSKGELQGRVNRLDLNQGQSHSITIIINQEIK